MELNNPQHEALAQHVAAGFSLAEAARRAGYAEGSVYNTGSRIAKMPEIAARIQELKASRAIVPGSVLLRSPNGRIAAIEDRWSRMRRIIMERSEDPDTEDVPGGKTGLLIKQVKQIGTGDKAQVVTSYVLDRDLLAELRAHEELAAEELGQRASRRETYSQSLKLTVTDPAQLVDVLRGQLGSLPASERSRYLMGAPAEVKAALEAEPSDPIDVQQPSD